jgi:hypothetical protein
MLSVFALLRDILAMFLVGGAIGFYVGWRVTRNHWKRKRALSNTMHKGCT